MMKYTFKWLIENFSYCWHEVNEELVSPTFFVEKMKSSWYLELYPSGIKDPEFISLYLKRYWYIEEPERIGLSYELSILDGNGRVLASTEKLTDEFEKDGGAYAEDKMLQRLRINSVYKDSSVTSDTLTVCCVMWKDSGLNDEDYCCARTRIGLEKVSFIVTDYIKDMIVEDQLWNKTFVIYTSKNEVKLSVGAYLCNFCVSTGPTLHDYVEEYGIMLDILPELENLHLMTSRLFLLDTAGKEVECGKIDNRSSSDRKHTLKVPMNLTLNLKLKDFIHHNLTVRCECTLSTGIEIQRIEETFHDLHFSPLLRERLNDGNILSYPEDSKSILDDLRCLYKDQILSDVQIKTGSRTFPAHKSVLCARSSVFRTMLTTNMDEKITACVQVGDLEDSTVDQFLLFLYTDKLEDLQWESALELYYAANKYDVGRLKEMCSSFFKSKLNTGNIVDLLILSDRHKDYRLKTEVVNFICANKNEIFCTDEWEGFIEAYPQLAAKTMHSYLKNKNG